jgi:FHS family Na+ dependent glucose MFS transporter 1
MKNQSNLKQANPLLVTSIYYLSFILLGLLAGAQGPSLLNLAGHTSSSLEMISLIFVAVSAGYLVGSFFSGMAYDRFPGHRLMAFSLAITAASSALIPVIQSLWLLLVAFFLLGMGTGTIDVGGNTLLLWLHGEKVGPFMNALHFFFGLGAFISPLILDRARVATGDIHWLFWLCALICIPLAAWLWFLPDPSSAAHTAKGESAGSFPMFPVFILVVLFVLYVGLELGFGNWVYTYALKLKLANESSAAYLTSAFWGAFTLGRLLGVWTAARARSQTILFIDLIGCIASTAVILLWRDSTLALWIGAIGLGLCMASIFPTVLMLAGERIHVTGAITGLFLVGSAIGSAFLPSLIGQVFDSNPRIMPVIVLVDISAFLLVLIYFVTQRFSSDITPGKERPAVLNVPEP